MGAIVEHNHDFYGKKFDDMNDKEQQDVKDYEEAMYGGNLEPLETPDTSDSKSIDSCFDD
jgi:hypothetical protein